MVLRPHRYGGQLVNASREKFSLGPGTEIGGYRGHWHSLFLAGPAALRRLATQQKPVSDYAATVIREAGWPELYFAFDDEADAQKFAASVKAEPIARYPGWASQRAFEMDGAKLRELEASLPPVRVQPKQPPSDHPRFRRGGPRASIRRYDEE